MQKNAKENAKNIQYFGTIWRGLLFSLIQNSFHSFAGAFTDDGTEHNQKSQTETAFITKQTPLLCNC